MAEPAVAPDAAALRFIRVQRLTSRRAGERCRSAAKREFTVASAIERFLYGSAADLVSPDGRVGGYFVADFCLAEAVVSLRFASNLQPYSLRRAVFRDASCLWFTQAAAEEDDLELPWEIVGFHSREEDGRWKFNLNCWHVRWSRVSCWPEVEDAERSAAP